MKSATRSAPIARLRPRRGGVLALALAVALPAPALSFLVGLAFATLHGPHSVLVHALPACTDIVLAHDPPSGGDRADHHHPPAHPSASRIGGPCAVVDAPAGHVICVSHAKDARATARLPIDLPDPGALAAAFGPAPRMPAPLPLAAHSRAARAAGAEPPRSVVLRL